MKFFRFLSHRTENKTKLTKKKKREIHIYTSNVYKTGITLRYVYIYIHEMPMPSFFPLPLASSRSLSITSTYPKNQRPGGMDQLVSFLVFRLIRNARLWLIKSNSFPLIGKHVRAARHTSNPHTHAQHTKRNHRNKETTTYHIGAPPRHHTTIVALRRAHNHPCGCTRRL